MKIRKEIFRDKKHFFWKKTVSRIGKGICFFMILCFLTFFCGTAIYAAPADEVSPSTSTEQTDPDSFDLNITSNAGSTNLSASLQMLLVLTVLALAPSILVMVTSFTRIIVVLHFVRSALGTQTTPPNQVLIGLALFLTFFIMNPVISQVNTEAVQPYSKGKITQEQAINKGLKPIRNFMFEQTNRKDIRLFLEISEHKTEVKSEEDIPTAVLIPSFIISELRTAFIIGFLIYLPFIIIDMVVASTLMSMGMMMLPPTTISLPCKILLFVLADGWNIVIGQVVKTFY